MNDWSLLRSEFPSLTDAELAAIIWELLTEEERRECIEHFISEAFKRLSNIFNKEMNDNG